MVVLDFVLTLIEIEKICEHLQVKICKWNFAFTQHAKSSWKSAPVSSNVSSYMSEMTRLFRSISILLNGNYAAMVTTLIFIDSLIRELLFASSSPLSVSNFSADPYIFIQQLKMALTIMSRSFNDMTDGMQKVMLRDE